MTGEYPEVDGLTQHHLEAKVDQAELRRKLAAVKSIVERCRLQFTEDGLYINTAGDNDVASVETTIDAEYTTDFEACTVGVETGSLYRAATFTGAPTESVTVRLDREPDENSPLSFSCSNSIDWHRMVALDTLDVTPARPELPIRGEAATATVPVRQFKAGVGVADVAGGHPIRISIGSRVVSFCPDPPKGGRGLWPISDDVTIEGQALSRYAASYLRDMATALPPGGDVTLRLSDAYPMAVETGDGLRFVLAPYRPNGLEDTIQQKRAERNGEVEV
ncbi:beta clamp domain-containing protein [Halostella litorea]|uniref:hypothetical protein n=1 Tax=Halostella litorea TaxID=2528831 RepID=UPI001091D8D4|nr:hypothetical protein [Halostella litorea]